MDKSIKIKYFLEVGKEKLYKFKKNKIKNKFEKRERERWKIADDTFFDSVLKNKILLNLLFLWAI